MVGPATQRHEQGGGHCANTSSAQRETDRVGNGRRHVHEPRLVSTRRLVHVTPVRRWCKVPRKRGERLRDVGPHHGEAVPRGNCLRSQRREMLDAPLRSLPVRRQGGGWLAQLAVLHQELER